MSKQNSRQYFYRPHLNQNLNYYNLIEEFYKKTNVPVLLNTSFNLAGDPVIETLEQAISVCQKSEFKYLYVPK